MGDSSCQNCGHKPEKVVASLIFGGVMHCETNDSMEELDQLDQALLEIDRDLHDEIKRDGTRSPLSKFTLTQLREMYS